MNWYKGNISEAVAQSKAKNAIFVVFIEGKDESTQRLTKFINEQQIRSKLETDDFVAIKIESESQAYVQFASIYQVVPVPSIFFIGKSGTPLEIGTGVITSVEELQQKIDKVLAASGKSTPSSVSVSASFIAGEQQQAATTSLAATAAATGATAKTPEAEETEIVCEGDVCYKRPKKPNAAEASKAPNAQEVEVDKAEADVKEKKVEKEAAQTEGMEKAEADVKEKETEKDRSPEVDANARLEETRKLLEQKRRERVEQEIQLEKERELRRRRDGKETQNLQSWQREQEFQEVKDNLRREKLAEQTARERVRAQIAADRAERAQKTAVTAAAVAAVVGEGAAKDTAATNGPQVSSTDMARLQFRLPSGSSKTHSFQCQETLSVVRAFVKSELLPGTGIKEFILATTYPKREFTIGQDDQTLTELGLFPSAVILVIGKESSSPAAIIARSGGMFNILTTLFWTMLSPVFTIYGYFSNIISRRGNNAAPADNDNTGAQKRANEERGVQHEAAKRRNLDRFLSGPSTSQDAADTSNTPPDNGEQQKPYRRYGSSNIHRLSDNRKDSDDENATWNGNSTQQQ